jgi:hypothetical protein
MINAAGITKPITAINNNDVEVSEAVLLKCCSLCFNPPKKKDIPSIRRRLERIEPSKDVLRIEKKKKRRKKS